MHNELCFMFVLFQRKYLHQVLLYAKEDEMIFNLSKISALFRI